MPSPPTNIEQALFNMKMFGIESCTTEPLNLFIWYAPTYLEFPMSRQHMVTMDLILLLLRTDIPKQSFWMGHHGPFLQASQWD
jgi:hypothetical protein